LYRAAAIATALAWVATSSSAEDVSISVEGIGGAPCSAVSAQAQTDAATTRAALAQWSYGYFGRRNIERALAGKAQVDLAEKGMTEEKLAAVILTVCARSPDAAVFQVVDILYNTLLTSNAPTS
jgi:hypothetical protein